MTKKGKANNQRTKIFHGEKEILLEVNLMGLAKTIGSQENGVNLNACVIIVRPVNMSVVSNIPDGPHTYT